MSLTDLDLDYHAFKCASLRRNEKRLQFGADIRNSVLES